MLENIVVHFYGHPINIMVSIIVHDGIGKHKHHVTLEFSCCSYRTILNMSLNNCQIFWSENSISKILVSDKNKMDNMTLEI